MMDYSVRGVADPVLAKQLRAALPDDRPVRVVLTLKTPWKEPSPRDFEKLARDVLVRAEEHVGKAARVIAVFGFINSLKVEAPARTVQELLHQPEVISAMAEDQPDFGLIRPVDEPRRQR